MLNVNHLPFPTTTSAVIYFSPLLQNSLYSNMKSNDVAQVKGVAALDPPGSKGYFVCALLLSPFEPYLAHYISRIGSRMPSGAYHWISSQFFLLPRPSLKERLQPPRLHFGWPFPANRIIEIGKQKKFVTIGVFHNPKSMEYVQLTPTEKRIQLYLLNWVFCHLGLRTVTV